MFNLNKNSNQGYTLIAVIGFLAFISVMSITVIVLSFQVFLSLVQQDNVKMAQLASLSALDYAKEQYELDINYSGTSETELYTDGQFRVTYEVISLGYSNPTNTQQDVIGIGRVYKISTGDVEIEKKIKSKIAFTGGVSSSVRFIFIVDNSGSMDTNEFNDAKSTINTAVAYVVNNIPTAEVAVVQHATNMSSREHRYDVTVPFTNDPTTATDWERVYGPGTTGSAFRGSHLAATLALMRRDNAYGPGQQLDLIGAEDVQFIIFTDAEGIDTDSQCCSAIRKDSTDPNSWFQGNGAFLTVEETFGEFNSLKDGTVFTEAGYNGLTSQMTMLNVNVTTWRETIDVSAAVASPGGSWTGSVGDNPGDPEGNGVLPRRYISTSLEVTDPQDIIDIINEIIETELNF